MFFFIPPPTDIIDEFQDARRSAASIEIRIESRRGMNGSIKFPWTKLNQRQPRFMTRWRFRTVLIHRYRNQQRWAVVPFVVLVFTIIDADVTLYESVTSCTGFRGYGKVAAFEFFTG